MRIQSADFIVHNGNNNNDKEAKEKKTHRQKKKEVFLWLSIFKVFILFKI